MYVNTLTDGRGSEPVSLEARHLIKHMSGDENSDRWVSSESSSSDSDSDNATSIVDSDDVEAVKPMALFTMSNWRAAVGFGAQYFAVGLMATGPPATLYGVFLGYLHVPAYVYSTTSVMLTLPWSLKLIFGALNDTVPIFGKNRVPYMLIGWSFCALALAKLAVTPLPPPYWCVDDAGDYITQEKLPNGHHQSATPCNPDAPKESGQYTFLLMLAAFGYIVADVAADGLMVQYAKLEPIQERGKTQSMAYLVRSIGMMISSALVGLCMNGKLYNGSFTWSMSFNGVCACFSVIACSMIPISYFFVHEPPCNGGRMSMQDYWRKVWDSLCGQACCFIIVFNVVYVAVGNVSTTAGPLIKEHWAGVENLQNQLFSMVGWLLFSICLWMVKEYFLNVSWRLMIVVCIVSLQIVDSVFTFCTIFDIVRNQYFYLGETVLIEFPLAASFIVVTFLCAEMSDDGNEGLMYGLFTTTQNLGSPFANAISNQIFRQFRPSLSNDDNYIEDDPAFRWTVFNSVLLSYGFSFLSLMTVWLIPKQKVEAQERKRTWPKHVGYGVFTVVFVFCAFSYSLSVNILSMFPSTMCLEYAGGEGCDPPASTSETNSTG